MNLSSKDQSMLKLEISETGTLTPKNFIHALRKNIATWIVWARIWNFELKTSLSDHFRQTRWIWPSENQRLSGKRQSKSKIEGNFDILAHTIHVYTFLFTFLIATFVAWHRVLDISTFNIDCGMFGANEPICFQNTWFTVLFPVCKLYRILRDPPKNLEELRHVYHYSDEVCMVAVDQSWFMLELRFFQPASWLSCKISDRWWCLTGYL